MIITGAGHRPNKLGGYGDDVYVRLRELARRWLREHPHVKRVLSGMALGWDQALAAAAVYEGVPFVAAIPFKGQESKWPDASRRRYFALLSRAAETVIVCDGGYSAEKMRRRNEWMVDHADTVLALWNGSASGTKDCIDYAREKNIPIINLWEEPRCVSPT